MKLLLKILLLLLFLEGCTKANDYKPCVGYSENIKVGIDNENKGYITDLDRNIQIVLLCDIKYGYKNTDFERQVCNEVLAWHPDWDKNEMESYGKSRIDWCIPEAFKTEEEYDSYFKRNLKKYYVFYKERDVYKHFNK